MGFVKISIGIGVGICGAIFVGYCIYFDRKRRQDPDYKKKVFERRRRNREEQRAQNICPPNNSDFAKRYFIQEIQLGEQKLAQGDLQHGAQHLANAVSVCAQPADLMVVLQTALPEEVYELLEQKLQETRPQQENSLPIGAVEEIRSL